MEAGEVTFLGWVCCVQHASELGFHPGDSSQDCKHWSGILDGCCRKHKWQWIGQDVSATRGISYEAGAAISRRSNGCTAVVQGMVVRCKGQD